MLAPGQCIDHYELVCPIADGAMAHVWAARERGSGRVVALKIVHSRYAADAAFRAMFFDEARVVAAIPHPNVARVYGIGEAGSTLYLAMEYVDGDSVFALTAPDRRVPFPIALQIVADACRGLDEVHHVLDASGWPLAIVHRDVSPQNLLVSIGGEVKLIDFGIAHARERAAPTTELGIVKGKARYIAPEQARREAVGPYTDVFGAGAVLFRMLAGRAPYAAADDVATMEALVANAPATSALPPEIPDAVVAIVERAIAPVVAHRYATAAEMLADIEAVLARELRAPDVAGWALANLPESTRSRRAALAPIPATAQAAGAGPGFMDVAALVATAKSGHEEPVPPDEPAPAAGALPAPKPAPITATAVQRASPSTRALRAAIIVIALVFAVLAALLLLPRIVRDRAIATAREAGLVLTVERVGVGASGVSLRDVTLKPMNVPGVTAKIQEIFLKGLSANDMRVTGASVRIEGKETDLSAGLVALASVLRSREAGTTVEPRHVSVANAVLAWDGIVGPDSRLEASDIGVEIDSRGVGVEDLRCSAGLLRLQTRQAHLGPWAATYERSPTSSRARLMFDPPVPDGPSALLVSNGAAPAELTVKIPRSPFANLGVTPKELALPADAATEVAVELTGRLSDNARSEIKGTAALWYLRPKGFHMAIDVRAEGTVTGLPGHPFDIERTTVTLGPFVAGVSGTLTPHDGGIRVDATFRAVPISCEKIARTEATGIGPLATLLQAVGQSTGALRVTGTVNASGLVKYDTADPGAATVSWLAKETCGVSIFGM